jgi:biotin carboxyl carrier protein
VTERPAQPEVPGQQFRVVVGEGPDPTEPAVGWALAWIDPAAGIARLTDGRRQVHVVVEGSGSEWFVTLRGRRIEVAVRSRREEALAAASRAAAVHAGPLEVRASLPGLVVAIQVSPGMEVAQGDPLLRLEAMKMQNEIRAPRAGRVTAVLVGDRETVGTGDVLLRLE